MSAVEQSGVDTRTVIIIFCVRFGPRPHQIKDIVLPQGPYQTGFPASPVQKIVETIEIASKCALESKEREPKLACMLAKCKRMLAHIRTTPPL